MKKLGILFTFLAITGCTFNKFDPDNKSVISSPNCEALNGYFSLNFDEYYHYNKSGFWQLRQYEKFKINLSNKEALFIGETKDGQLTSLTLSNDKWSCSNGVLSADLENVVQNNGGVSVYQARSLAFYSYQPGKVIIQFKEHSSGLAFFSPCIGRGR